jgi:hypothetical protein
MSNNKKNSSAGGIGLLGLLALIFITLKLTGVIGWNWWWVLSPLWIPAAIAVLIFIAPPDPASLRQRLEGRGTDPADAIERRLRTAEIELEAQAEFPHVIVNDKVQKSASELEKLVRSELSLH